MHTDSSMFHSAEILLVLLSFVCSTVVVNTDNVQTLAKANNDFGLRLCQTLAKSSKGNIFFSPLSLSTALAILEFGARGKTQKELRSLLGYEQAGLSDENVQKAFSELPEKMKKDSEEVKLSSANSLLVGKSKTILPDYITQVARLFGASVRVVDFQQSAQVKEDINKWVSNQTNGKITQLLDSIDPSAELVILNAVYFKGQWVKIFESALDLKMKFYNNGDHKQARRVPAMRITTDFMYVDYRGTKVLELPYNGSEISMLIMLPAKGQSPDNLLSNLTAKVIDEMQGQLKMIKVHLLMPKFKLQYSRKLNQDMQDMGAKDMFLDSANFSGISKVGVKVSQIFHKSTLSVDENGSEAAAGTAVESSARKAFFPKPIIVCFKRPFLLAIVHRKVSNMVLFLGRVAQL